MDALDVVAPLIAAGLGLGAGAALRGRPRALAAVRGVARGLAAVAASIFFVAFAAGVGGAVAQGDDNPALVVLALGLGCAAALLWRGRHLHLAVGGHWLAALWLLYSAVIGRHSAAGSALFVAVSLPALFTAASESIGAAEGGGEQGVAGQGARR